MNAYEIFAVALALVQIIGGTFGSWLWSAYAELKRHSQQQDAKIRELELNLVKNYPNKDDFNRFGDDVLAKIETVKRDISEIQIQAAKK